ncbi:peptide-methionine (S)-S-oxide reductase MsrA [Robertkochia solimangrovi]|uniref:peptide-methionine (S)-S-oxide reductase MsrA n=1 Tax=Robertkochia solimangrovi TaxID=2213046 RepID=UPI00117FE1ED|nr:peptide-methionine (S)-S-oxide reductase MsrA [Robertkochia solimangrovi]TRZ45444.1 peptide-methionine (S)-S-oxide reductase [Robertkochia solimangrovi]
MDQENTTKEAIFAGGCFWCTEAVFERVKGVRAVVSGYTGGSIKNPAYREVCTGRTGHAEAIKITYDENEISYHDLLEIFFSTHDPTTLNRQGNDSGTQYRSAIFYTDEKQHEAAVSFIEILEKEKVFPDPVVTTVEPEKPFYVAEENHQDYYNNNTEQPYCQVIISPKIKKLNRFFNDKLKSTYGI